MSIGGVLLTVLVFWFALLGVIVATIALGRWRTERRFRKLDEREWQSLSWERQAERIVRDQGVAVRRGVYDQDFEHDDDGRRGD
jgi:hypothetical protein